MMRTPVASQWRARNPPGEEGEQLLPPPVRQGYLYLLSMADYAVEELWVSFLPLPSGTKILFRREQRGHGSVSPRKCTGFARTAVRM